MQLTAGRISQSTLLKDKTPSGHYADGLTADALEHTLRPLASPDHNWRGHDSVGIAGHRALGKIRVVLWGVFHYPYITPNMYTIIM